MNQGKMLFEWWNNLLFKQDDFYSFNNGWCIRGSYYYMRLPESVCITVWSDDDFSNITNIVSKYNEYT